MERRPSRSPNATGRSRPHFQPPCRKLTRRASHQRNRGGRRPPGGGFSAAEKNRRPEVDGHLIGGQRVRLPPLRSSALRLSPLISVLWPPCSTLKPSPSGLPPPSSPPLSAALVTFDPSAIAPELLPFAGGTSAQNNSDRRSPPAPPPRRWWARTTRLAGRFPTAAGRAARAG